MLDVVKHEETEQSYPQAAWGRGRATWVHLGEASVSLAVPFLNQGWMGGDQFTDSITQCRLPCLTVLENLIWMRTQEHKISPWSHSASEETEEKPFKEPQT